MAEYLRLTLREPTGRARTPLMASLVMAVVLVAAACTPAGPWSDPDHTVRIMAIGDSITHGSDGHASYRYPLWHALQGAGCNVDFVGTQSTVYQGSPPDPNYDQDHDGHWGWRADEVFGSIYGWAEAADPDVVLLHIGTNDARQGQSAATTREDIEGIIYALRFLNPDVAILLARVIPAEPWADTQINALNQEIVALPAALTTPESPIILVDQHAGFNRNTMSYDSIHPNATGEARMSDRWLAGLRNLPAWPC